MTSPTVAEDGESLRDIRKHYMVYVVLDASKSMRTNPSTGRPARTRAEMMEHTPLGFFIRLLPGMVHRLSEVPMLSRHVAVSIVAFHDKPQVLLDMSLLDRPHRIREPVKGVATDYGAVLRHLVELYPGDLSKMEGVATSSRASIEIARPWIYFITDGKPYADEREQLASEWLPERAQLVEDPIGARIVTLGLPGADEGVLWDLATGTENRRNALISEPGLGSADLADSVTEVIRRSITASTSLGDLAVTVPARMRRARRKRS